jgi:hypothetical protein
MPYGRQSSLIVTGSGTQLTADGRPEWKTGGVTIDWTTIAAVGSDTTLPDGTVIKSGLKFQRYGQLLCKITTQPVQTLTGTATGGTFTLTLLRPDTQTLVTTAALAFNATAAQVLAAIQAVMGPNQVASASGGALGTAAVTLTFNAFVPIIVVNGGALTGGTVTPAVTTAGTANGKYGPHDPGASDGRQTLTPGECGLLNETILQSGYVVGLPTGNVDNCGVVVGGRVYLDRLIAIPPNTGSASLASGPTRANLLVALPRLMLVEMS